MARNIIDNLRQIVNKIINLFSVHSDEKIHPFYSKEIFNGHKYIIGEYTYGTPKILFENDDSNLFIGKYCSIAENVTIFLGGNHRTDWVTTYPFNVLRHKDFENPENIKPHSATKGNVEIGNDVWIGYGVIILSGVKIRNGAVVAAGSVVTKDIGAYEIWGGNPARLIRKRFTDKEIESLEKIAWWNWSDEKIKSSLNQLCNNSVEEFINIHITEE